MSDVPLCDGLYVYVVNWFTSYAVLRPGRVTPKTIIEMVQTASLLGTLSSVQPDCDDYPEINCRVLYPTQTLIFLSSAAWPSMPKKHFYG